MLENSNMAMDAVKREHIDAVAQLGIQKINC